MSNMSGVDVRGFGNKLFICNNHNALFFSVGKIIYWVSNFGQWAGVIY